MPHTLRKYARGFTLIELLVVIAIIGLLAAIVLVSLQTSRQKARDSRRVGDLAQVVTALGLYYDTNRQFPAVAASGFCGLVAPLAPYLSPLPRDPLDTTPCPTGVTPNTVTNFQYEFYLPSPASATPQEYLLRAILENSGSAALRSDVDNPATSAGGITIWDGGASSGAGLAPAGSTIECGDAAAPVYCFRS